MADQTPAGAANATTTPAPSYSLVGQYTRDLSFENPGAPGSVLLGGLLFGRALLSLVLETVLQLDEEGWRKLTFRWGLFFFVLAAINEVVWRTQTQDFWVAFKVWGVMPLTMLFALAQTPLILKHEIKPAKIEE